jgi:hypothetical protein
MEWEFPADEEPTSTMRRTWLPNSVLHRFQSDEFCSFMGSVLCNYPGYLTQMYGLYAPPGEIDFVGRTESLVDDLLEALEGAGIDVNEEAIRNTEKVNTSPQRVSRPDWNDDLRDAVRRLEAPVFERFEYE